MEPPGRAASCSFCGAAPRECPPIGSVCGGAWRVASAAGATPVVAAVVRRSGRVLLCRRPAHKRHGGQWEFPGGKLLPGETIGEAASRELREELDLELEKLISYFGSEPDPGATFVIHFVEAVVSGEPVSLEHDEAAWVLPEEIPRLELAPGDRAFVERGMGGRDAGQLV